MKRIPRKSESSFPLNKCIDIQSSEITPTKPADIFSLRIPRKNKHGASASAAKTLPNNNKRRTNYNNEDRIATKTPKKLKPNDFETTPCANYNIKSTPMDKQPKYEIIREGRIVGYPVVVTQKGTENDAILLGCKDNENPEEYLETHKYGSVRVRWKYAGYNGNVPADSVKLLAHVVTPPIRKAAASSGLLQTEGEQGNTKDNTDMEEEQEGEDEEDDDAPILKAIKSHILEKKIAEDKDDAEYKDEEDKDETLVCYKRTAPVGQSASGNKLPAAESSLCKVTDTVANSATHEEDNHVPTAQKPDVANNESSDGCEREAQQTPFSVEAPVPVMSSILVKTEEEDTDDEMTMQHLMHLANDVAAGAENAVYGYDTDSDAPKPYEIWSDMHVKSEDTDTDSDAPRPLEAKSSGIYMKKEGADADNQTDVEPLASCIEILPKLNSEDKRQKQSLLWLHDGGQPEQEK